MVFLVLVVAALVMYVFSLLVPRQGERFCEWITPPLRRMENHADEAPGVLGWLLKGPFWASRKSVNKSTDLGKKTRNKLK